MASRGVKQVGAGVEVERAKVETHPGWNNDKLGVETNTGVETDPWVETKLG